ncbi:MAG TPA: flagellar biosynthesis protein FlhB [Longimicrobiaceae bacterium]|nr:flagellar biosynthesis protein FlhB [Longimicrobiaceae bacterium]
MSDSTMQEKTERATPRKREEAHREGQVPRSQELTTAFMLLGGALVVNTLAPVLGSTVLTTFHHWMVLVGSSTLDAQTTISALQLTGWKVMAGLSLFLCALAGITLAVNVGQARGVLSGKPLEPKWERINPLPNAKRMLGVQPWAELVKSLLKLLIVGIAVYFSIRLAWSESLTLAQQAPIGLVDIVRRYSVRLLTTAGGAYIALALLDYSYQMWQHEKKLRMSKQEVKQETKQAEGDPLIKARLRSMGRALARRQMMGEVPNADVVVTNPTHIAVALKYDPTTAEAPLVLAMGQRKVAERIKAIAAEAGVPMVENKPLARAMFTSCRVGIPIPAELYIAVAEVLAFVIRQRNGGRTARGRAS